MSGKAREIQTVLISILGHAAVPPAFRWALFRASKAPFTETASEEGAEMQESFACMVLQPK